MLPQSIMPYSTALFMGITAGVSHCSVMCSPAMSTYIMGSRQGLLDGIKSFAVFTLGRVFIYAALGMLSGAVGMAFMGTENGLKYAGLFYSLVLISIGLIMAAGPVSRDCTCLRGRSGMLDFLSQRLAFNPTAHMFLMGTAFSLVPCPPMTAMLVYSMGMPSMISGGVVMSLFGIGTAISPLLIICAIAGCLSSGIRKEAPPRYKNLFQRLSGAILMLIGCLSLISC